MAYRTACKPSSDGLISIGGSPLGIAFGFFLSWLIARAPGWRTVVTTASVAIAFGVPVMVGSSSRCIWRSKHRASTPSKRLRYE